MIFQFDYSLFQFINGFAGQDQWLDALGIFFASYLQYILCLGLAVYFVLRKNYAEIIKNIKILAVGFLAALVSRFVFGEIVKRIFERPRPFVAHPQVAHQLIPYVYSDASFISGHMAFFFALSMVLYRFNKKAGQLLFLGSFLMGLARIYVGVHYPSDILGGMILGSMVGWGSWSLYRRYFEREEKKA